MYAIISSCLLQWCPGMPSFYPTRHRNYGGTEDDDREYEKYQPRPKIVIDPDVASLDSFITETAVVMCEGGEPSLMIAAQFSNQKKTVLVKIISCSQMAWTEDGETSTVCIALSCCKTSKQQTTGQDGTNPTYNQTFSFSNVELNDLQSTSLKFRVYSRKGRTRAALRAEAKLEGSGISCDGPIQYVLRLERIQPLKSEIPSIAEMNSQNIPIPSPVTGLSPSMHRFSNGNVVGNDSRRSSMVDACGRFCSQPNNDLPELLISLSYDGDHSNLTIGVERGSQFGEKQKPPDTFIKICAVGEFGNEVFRQKSEVVKGSIEPNYEHQSSISINKNDLEGVTVKIEVWQSVGVLRRRQQIGYIAVGLNSTTQDAQEHWQQMIQGKGMALSKWHTLQMPE